MTEVATEGGGEGEGVANKKKKKKTKQAEGSEGWASNLSYRERQQTLIFAVNIR